MSGVSKCCVKVLVLPIADRRTAGILDRKIKEAGEGKMKKKNQKRERLFRNDRGSRIEREGRERPVTPTVIDAHRTRVDQSLRGSSAK